MTQKSIYGLEKEIEPALMPAGQCGQDLADNRDGQIWNLDSRWVKPHAVEPHPEIIPQDRHEAHVYVIPCL